MHNVLKLLATFTVLLTVLGCTENALRAVNEVDTGDGLVDTGYDDIDEIMDDPPIEAPIADAGPDRSMTTGEALQLNGNGSYDPAGLTPLTFDWTMVGRPPASGASLDDPTSATPAFTADVSGQYAFELTVANSEEVWDETPATVLVDASPVPVFEPVSNAGVDQTVDEGIVVQLDGTASFDPAGFTPLTYQWAIVSTPPTSTSGLSSPIVSAPTLLADVPGIYVLQLVVTNSQGTADSSPDRVVITANQVPVANPVANAGPDQAVTVGDFVTLDATGSYDPGGLAPLSYKWTVTYTPPSSGAALTSLISNGPQFLADKPGNYAFHLTVQNTAGKWDMTPDSVVINATTPPPAEPIADAGPDQLVSPLSQILLDGSASRDPGGLGLNAWQWTMVSRPPGSTAALNNTAAVHPGFFADLAGDYVFDLTVRNNANIWDSTPDRVVVTSEPLDGFYVEVSWDNVNDLDLHVLNGNAALFSTDDCNFSNLSPEWGGAGTSDNPSLDWDAVYGWGPETTTIDVPANGEYIVKVHYYGLDGARSCAGGCPSSLATVNVYVDGQLAATYKRTLSSQGDLWTVARISWPTGAVHTIDQMGYAN